MELFCVMDSKTQCVETLVLHNLTYRFNTIPIKIPASYQYFVDIDKLNLKYMESQKTQNSQHNIKEKEQSHRTDTFQLQNLL